MPAPLLIFGYCTVSSSRSSQFRNVFMVCAIVTFISAPCFQHESAKKALAPISAEQCVDKTVPEYNTHHLVPRSDNRWRGCGAALLNCNPVVIVTAAHCVDVRRRHISDILC